MFGLGQASEGAVVAYMDGAVVAEWLAWILCGVLLIQFRLSCDWWKWFNLHQICNLYILI
jgi:hypothetical protein